MDGPTDQEIDGQKDLRGHIKKGRKDTYVSHVQVVSSSDGLIHVKTT